MEGLNSFKGNLKVVCDELVKVGSMEERQVGELFGDDEKFEKGFLLMASLTNSYWIVVHIFDNGELPHVTQDVEYESSRIGKRLKLDALFKQLLQK